jgi:FdrA protein
MTATKTEIRRGAYYDSIVLMQLQAALAKLSNIQNVGVMMGTEANKDLLAQSGLLSDEAGAALPDDLIISVQGEDEASAQAALKEVDSLLARRQSAVEQMDYLPQSIEAAAKMLPAAGWVLVSAPGRYAAGVARESLRLGKHVFLYSDNVSLEDEISLKQTAAQQKLLLMGPDCGTAIINGVGLGFANRVRRGPIGVVGASGTGLQQVTARIHQLGGGITHAIGTGGRDLSEAVGAITAQQGLDLLSRDPDTRVIILISKPPAPMVADQLLRLARAAGKPVVVNFIGYTPPAHLSHQDTLCFASSLDQTAELAIRLAHSTQTSTVSETAEVLPFAKGQRYLRGLFSGGTLAYEALLILQDYLPVVYSNAPLNKEYRLANPLVSQAHTIIDLGEDEFTVGRLHPMLDNTLRLQRLQQEANDPGVAIILLDVVLGYGAHPNPAGELAPAIATAIAQAREAGRYLEVVAIVVGTDEDPQNMAEQLHQLQEAGARVETNNEVAIRYIGQRLQALNPPGRFPPVELAALHQPLNAINVGLESFTQSLVAQQASVIHVNWRPPAGGNQKLMSILERMKQRRD